MSKFFITEEDRRSILNMHGIQNQHAILENIITDSVSTLKESIGQMSEVFESIVITDWLSPDNKYVILFDELYDLTDNVKLGDIWENFDNFKLFISHSFNVAKNVPQQIKESVNESLKSLMLTESVSDYRNLKPIIKQLIKEEGFFDWVGSGIKKTGEWAVNNAKKFGKDVSDLFSTGWEGLKKAGIAISQGEWKDLLNILQKGMLFVARKIRHLMYNPVGIVLDSILVATGIGKAVQWIPWAIIVALDLYEIISGDYEEKDMSTWMRWLMVGIDVLGLIFTGGVAGSARAAFKVFKGIKSEAQFAEIAAKNPATISWIQKIVGAFSKVPQYLGKAATYLKSTKLAKASPWIENILTKSEGVLTRATESLNKLSNSSKTAIAGGKQINTIEKAIKPVVPLSQIAKKGATRGLKTAGVVTVLDKAFKKGAQAYYGLSDKEMDDIEANQTAQSDLKVSLDNYEKQTGKKPLSGFD
jgi:hypothetical protein